MNVLTFCSVAVIGLVACAEFGSYAFVHPVLRRLPEPHRIDVEQGLLRTFGRFMPLGMPLCVVLGITYAVDATVAATSTLHVGLAWASAGALIAAVGSTIVVNVPINLATGRWDRDDPPEDWSRTRDRWDWFQGLRSWLLLIGFVLLTAAVSFTV